MKMSCVIPTKDRRDMVCRAIESVLRQRPTVPEIIVVDDGSADYTKQTIEKHFPDVIIESCHGVGPGIARNRGVERSRGDIIMFLDSDDEWFPEHAEKLLSVLEAGYQVAYGTTETVSQINGEVFLIPAHGHGIEGDCLCHLLRWCFLVPSSIALHRKVFYTVGGFSHLSIGEDWLFFLKLACHFKFGFAGQNPISRRYLHQNSLCAQVSRGVIVEILENIRTHINSVQNISLEAVNHFDRMYRWTICQQREWRTIQEWYTDLYEEGFV